jgi:hypothetical protein
MEMVFSKTFLDKLIKASGLDDSTIFIKKVWLANMIYLDNILSKSLLNEIL